MTDRYERIRAALAMGPTPGPWYGDDNSVSCPWSNGTVGIREYIALPDSAEDSTPNPANMHFIAACDPDTIRALLDERDALLDALRQIAEWPDGGNRYGQRNIKRFAQAAIDACDPDTIRELIDERDALAAENERLRDEVERLRTDGASAVRWAPGSAYWSEVLVELFGPDARKGIDVLETRWRKELERAERLAEALKEIHSRLKELILQQIEKYKGALIEMEVMPDHVDKLIEQLKGDLQCKSQK